MQSTIPLTLTPESSQLYGYGYDEAMRTLAVEFRSNKDQRTYHYTDVTPEKAAALDAAPSKGTFIYKQIKNVHDFVPMEKEPDPQEDEQQA